MEVFGKVGDIMVTYQQEKEREDGSKFWGERYQIAFEVGDDIHLIDTRFIHCQSKDGGIEILKRRGIYVGAYGKMRFRYGYRTWEDPNGKQKRIREVEIDEFTNMMPKATPAETIKEAMEPENPQPIKDAIAKAAVKAAMEHNQVQVFSQEGSSDLPF